MNTEKGEELNQILGKWGRKAAKMDSYIAEDFEINFDHIISKLDGLTDPDKAFGYLVAVIIIFNKAIKENPSILEKLLKWIKKLKEKLDVIAKDIEADNYSISAGLSGVSVEISFSPK